jgi:hypothetical protein
VKQEVIGEGTHFMIPWVQRPILFDIRAKPKNVPTITGSTIFCIVLENQCVGSGSVWIRINFLSYWIRIRIRIAALDTAENEYGTVNKSYIQLF